MLSGNRKIPPFHRLTTVRRFPDGESRRYNSGDGGCTRGKVEAICRKHGVDPIKKGWTAAAQKGVAEFKTTPEFVHGATVGSPQLAAAIRKAGLFSGKREVPLNDKHGEVLVYRDQHGFAPGVESEDEKGSSYIQALK